MHSGSTLQLLNSSKRITSPTSDHTMPGNVFCPFSSYAGLSCHVISCLLLSCPILSCLVLYCLVFSHSLLIHPPLLLILSLPLTLTHTLPSSYSYSPFLLLILSLPLTLTHSHTNTLTHLSHNMILPYSLSYHYRNSLGERQSALKYTVKAADQAIRRGAFAIGYTLCNTALPLAVTQIELGAS